MGMIVTLYLISTNVYSSLDAPPTRGFSYIEIWMMGAQFPILLALLEYGYILHLKKSAKENKVINVKTSDGQQRNWSKEIDLDKNAKYLDYATMIISLVLFLVFVFIYYVASTV